MTINFPDVKEVIRIYERKGVRGPLSKREEISQDRVSISEEARKKLAEIRSQKGG